MDETDRKIVMCLQENARMTFSDIAKQIGKPTSTVFERVKKLENDGVIKGYRAVLDPLKVERGFTAFVFGQAKLGQDINLDRVGMELAKIPEVQEVHFVTGPYDYLVKMRVKDQKEYYRVVQKIASHFEGRGEGRVAPKTFKDDIFLSL